MRVIAIGLVSLGLVVLGARLLRLSRRSGATPEFWLGLAFLLGGATVWLIPVAATQTATPNRARVLAFAAQFGVTAATACLVIFAQRVFRADSREARWLAAALVAANAAALGAMLQSGVPLPVGPAGLMLVAMRSAAFVWLFLESAIYAQRMRRRVRLGLGDPIIANRFALWSIWTGALACIPLFVLALRVLGLLVEPVAGEPLPVTVRWIVAVLGAGGAAALGAGWLAFFPPIAYQRWIVARATA